MEVLYHIRPYDTPLHRPYLGLIYGRYLHFRILKWPLNQDETFSQRCKQRSAALRSLSWATWMQRASFFFYLQDGGFPFDSFQLPKKSGLTMVYGRYKYTYIMGFANHGAPSCGRSCVMLETGCVRRVAPSNKREYKRESPRVDAAVYSSILCKSIVSGWNTSEILVISHWRFTLCIQA